MIGVSPSYPKTNFFFSHNPEVQNSVERLVHIFKVVVSEENLSETVNSCMNAVLLSMKDDYELIRTNRSYINVISKEICGQSFMEWERLIVLAESLDVPFQKAKYNELAQSCLEVVVKLIELKTLDLQKFNTQDIEFLTMQASGKTLEDWNRLISIAQLFKIPVTPNYKVLSDECLNAVVKALELKQLDSMLFSKEAFEAFVIHCSGKSIEEWKFLIAIAQSFKVPIVSNFEALSHDCIEACETAYEQNQWHLIQAYDKKGKKGENGLSFLRDHAGKTLLMRLLTKPAYVKHMIDHNVAIQETDRWGNNALHIAAKEGLVKIVSSLRQKLGIIDTNHRGETPIHISILYGQDAVLKILLEMGFKLDHPYNVLELNSTITLFLFCVMRGEIPCLRLLLNELVKEKEEFLEQKMDKVGNFLHIAVHFRQIKMLRYLLQSPELNKYLSIQKLCVKDFLEQKNSLGLTPLNLAACLGDAQSIEILYRQGAIINTADAREKTPLHHAALQKEFDAVKVLTALGADLKALCKGDTPLASLKQSAPEKEWDVDTKNIVSFLTNISSAKFNERIEFILQMYENLALKGGGPKGYAYLGVIRALEQLHIMPLIKRIAGTSSGAITASLVCAGANSITLEALMDKTDMLEILFDPPVNPSDLILALENRETSAYIVTLWRVLKSARKPVDLLFNTVKTISSITGICKGERFRLWIEAQIHKMTGIPYCTFGELKQLIRQGRGNFKHLTVFATKIGDKPEVVRMDSEYGENDNFIISDGIRASMSIPIVFVPHIMHIKVGKDRVPYKEFGTLVDGGVAYNLPVEAYDRQKYLQKNSNELQIDGNFPCFNTRTIGFDLCSKTEPVKFEKVETVFDLLKGLFSIFTNEEALLRQMNPYNASRIVPIDVGNIGLLDFDLNNKQKKNLDDSGFNGTMKSLKDNHPTLSHCHTSTMITNTLKGLISLPKAILDAEFKGREEELKVLFADGIGHNWHQIHAAKVIQIKGGAGIGKTELALNFAYKHLEEFSLVKFINCQQPGSYHRAYRELGEVLSIPLQNKSDEEVIKAVNQALTTRTFKDEAKNEIKPWLLIFDGVEEDIPFPKNGGTILLTSKEKTFDTASLIPLNGLEYKGADKGQAQLLNAFNGSPLLLTLANNYIQCSDKSIEDYIELLKEKKGDVKDKVIEITLDHLRERSPRSLEFLKQISCLSPYSIDLGIEECALQNSRENLLFPLEQLGIAKYEVQGSTFSCRREFYILPSDDELLARFNAAVQLLALFAQKFDPLEKATWKSGTYLFEQVDWLMKNPLWLSEDHFQDKMTCLNKAGRYITCTEGDVQSALEIHKAALKIAEKSQQQSAEIQIEIGRCHALLKNHAAALEAFGMANQLLDQNSPLKGELWLLRGKSELKMKKYPDAILCYQEAGKFYANDLVNSATCLTLIADTMLKQSALYGQTLAQYENALKAWEKACEKNNDPRLIECRNQLGQAHLAYKKGSNAEKVFNEVLILQKEIFKEGDIEIAKTHYHLALSYMLSRKYEEASKHIDTALKIEKGPSKWHTRFIWQKGLLCAAKGSFSLASEHYVEAFEYWLKKDRLSEKEKQQLSQAIKELVKLYSQLKEPEIKNLQDKVGPGCSKLLGKEHPSVINLYKTDSACIIS